MKKKIVNGLLICCWIVTIWIVLSFFEINSKNHESDLDSFNYSKFNFFVLVSEEDEFAKS